MDKKRLTFIRPLVEKFPHAGNLTIAKMLVRSQPQEFPDIELARSSVRYWRGCNGPKNRRAVGIDILPNRELAPGKKRIGGWVPYKVKLPCRALILSDVHIPYHEDDALGAALDCGKKEGVDTIILDGDILDSHAISWWQTDPRERDFPGEVEQMRLFLCSLRRKFPKAHIIYKLGNHEERYENYMISKAPELLSVDLFAFDTLLWLDELQIDLVDEKRRIEVGDLDIIHGHEYRGGKTNPVNPARGLFLKAKSYAVCGHFHQSSFHPGKSIRDKVLGCWSLGCLCDLHPHHQAYNEWNHGFGIAEANRDGSFEFRGHVIKKGKAYSS